MKIFYKFLLIVVAILALAYYWSVNYNFRFEKISDRGVYKSALIDPDRLDQFLITNEIKTVINLLDPGTKDRLNPGQMEHIIAEDVAIERINNEHNSTIRHINIPSGQIPTAQTLEKFFAILDDNSSYPVLIHCYHGTGRAAIYSAIYRIEYEGFGNEDARMLTRALPILVESPLYKSSFAQGRSKGDFLINYHKRNENNSTIEHLKKSLNE